MAKSAFHVVPHDRAWAVKREGEQVGSTQPTQKDAIEAARDLARERDDIVIHGPDGTIREHISYSGPVDTVTVTSTPNRTARAGTVRDEEEVHPRDVMSVGTRVRWSAVFAGAVTALSLYILLNLLALALGLSVSDNMSDRAAVVTAGAISAIIMVGAVFLGGFVASRAAVGEERDEAITYGVLVWGTILLFLLAGGLGAGIGTFATLRPTTPAAVALGTEDVKRDLKLTNDQAALYAAKVREAQQAAPDKEVARRALWWTFAAAALSLVSAIGGGYTGAGPEFVLRPVREVRTETAVVPQPM